MSRLSDRILKKINEEEEKEPGYNVKKRPSGTSGQSGRDVVQKSIQVSQKNKQNNSGSAIKPAASASKVTSGVSTSGNVEQRILNDQLQQNRSRTTADILSERRGRTLPEVVGDSVGRVSDAIGKASQNRVQVRPTVGQEATRETRGESFNDILDRIGKKAETAVYGADSGRRIEGTGLTYRSDPEAQRAIERIRESQTAVGSDYDPTDMINSMGLDEDQQNEFWYRYARDGRRAAVDYANELASEWAAEDRARDEAEAERFAVEHPVLGSARAIVDPLLSAIPGAAVAAVAGITGSEVDPNHPAFRGDITGEASTRGVQAAAREATGAPEGGWTDQAIGIGLSIGQNIARYGASAAAAAATGGGSAVMSAVNMGLSGTQAAVSTIRQAAEQDGVNAAQIVANGIASGIAEGFFERYSLESLIKMAPADSVKNFVGNLVKQMAVEGQEEMATEISNSITDALIMGESSNFEQYRQEYLQAGASEEEATKGALKQIGANVLYAGFAGAISGGFMAGPAMAINSYRLQRFGSSQSFQTAEDFSELADSVDTSVESYVDQNGNVDEETLRKAQEVQQMAADMAQRSAAGETVNNYQKGELAARVYDLVNSAERTQIQDAETVDVRLLPVEINDEQSFLEASQQWTNILSRPDFQRADIAEEGASYKIVRDGDTFTISGGRTDDSGFEPMNISAGRDQLGTGSDEDIVQFIPFQLSGEPAMSVKVTYAPDQTAQAAEIENMDHAQTVSSPEPTAEMPRNPENAANYAAESEMSSQLSAEAPGGRSAAVSEISGAAINAKESGLSDSAKETMVAMYDGRSPMRNYMTAFRRYYAAGREDLPMSYAENSPYAVFLTTEQKKAAFREGALERNRAIERRQQAEDQRHRSRGGNREGGLSYASMEATDAQKKVAEHIGKRTGLKIEIRKLKEIAEYDSENGIIRIDPEAENFNASLAHELTHFIQDYDQKSYEAFKRLAIEALMTSRQESFDELYDRYERPYMEQYGGVDYDIVTDEMAADAAGMFLNDEEFINRVVSADRSLAEKIRDFFRDIADALRDLISGNVRRVSKALRENEARYRTAQGLWTKALETAGERNRSGEQSITGLKIKKQLDMSEPVEETGSLIAVHNLTDTKLENMLQYESIPMPSIAITKADIGHTNFGDISLVFRKDTIDPADPRNKVYSADAWTPTFPPIDYEMDMEKAREVYDELRAYAEQLPGVYNNAVQQYAARFIDENYLSRQGGVQQAIKDAENNTSLKAAYLVAKGDNVNDLSVRTEKRSELPMTLQNAYSEIIEDFGNEDLGKLVVEDVRDRVRDAYERGLIRSGITRDDATKKAAFMTKTNQRTASLLQKVIDYQKNGPTKISYEIDNSASDKNINDRVDKAEYEAWVNNLYDGLELGSGVWNGQSYIDDEGDRRSFRQTHYPVTAENIVRAMLSQNDDVRNVVGFMGSKSIRAVVSDEFDSIEDIHRAEGKLRTIDQDEFNRLDDEINNRLMGIINSIVDRSGRTNIMSYDYVGEVILDAAREKYSPVTIENMLRRYNWPVTKSEAKDLAEIFDRIRDMPVNMFEAKPQRTVGYDEIAAAVIPDNLNNELRAKLEEKQVPTIEYEAGNEEQRKNIVASIPNVRFQIRELDDGTPYVDVDVDQERFDGLSLKEQMKEAQKVLRERFKGKTFGYAGNQATVDRSSVDEYRKNFYKSGGRIIRYSDEEFGAKARVSTEIDNLLKASKFVRHETDSGYHKDAVRGWDYYTTLFEINGKRYQATLNVMNRERDRLLYDITKIKNKASDSQQATSKEDPLSMSEASSDVNISQDEVQVNPMQQSETDRRLRKQLDIDEQSNIDPERLVEANENLQITTQLLSETLSNATYMPSDEQIQRTVKKLKTDTKSLISDQELFDKLKTLYNYVQHNDNIDGEEMAGIASDIADSLLSNSKNEYDPEDVKLYREYLDHIKGYEFKIGDAMLEEVKYRYGSMKDLRSRYFGRLDIKRAGDSNIDQIYQELSEMYPADFPSDVSNDADQLAVILDGLDALRPHVKNPADDMSAIDYRGYTYEIGKKIFDDYFTPQAKAEFNKAFKNYREATQRQYQRNLARTNRRNQELIQKLASEYAHLETEEQKETNRQRQAALRDQRRRQQQAMTAYRRAADAESRHFYNDRYNIQRDRQIIMKDLAELNSWLLKPTDKKHVPESLRASVADFLSGIDFSSDRLNLKGDPTAMSKSFAQLKETYRRIKDGEASDLTQLMDVDPDMLHMIDELVESTEGISRLGYLDAYQTRTLKNVIRAMKKSITDVNKLLANKRYESVASAAESTMTELDARKPQSDKLGVKEKAGGFLKNDMLDSYTRFHTFGAAAESMYNELREGFNVKIRSTKEASDYMHALMDRTGTTTEDLQKWGGIKADMITYTTDGGDTIKLKPSQIMSLYALNKRYQAQKHLYAGGINTVPLEYTDGKVKKKLKWNKNVKLTKYDVNRLISKLTPQQKAVADGIGQFFMEYTSKWGNEASMAMYGYEKFLAKDYFPIKVDRNQVATKDDQISGNVELIKNMGETKGTQEKATNPILLDDIFNVFTTQVDHMGSYRAFLVPLSDMQKWLNYRRISYEEAGLYTDQDKGGTEMPFDPNAELTPVYKGSVKQSIENAYGKKAVEYVRKLLQDINGATTSDPYFLNRIISSFKGAAMGMNIRTAIQQPTAYLRAINEIDAKYILKGLKDMNPIGSSQRADKVKKYSAIAQWKDWGFYETDIGRSMRSILMGNATKLESIRDKQMIPNAKGDEIAWNALWRAAELETQDKYKDLEVGSDAFYETVADRFDEIVDRTQVVDSVFHRTQLMRSKDGLTKMATSFMSEPAKSYNMLYRAYFDYTVAGSDAEKKEAVRKMIRAGMAYIVSGVGAAAAASIVSAIRDDDEDKKWGEKYFDALGDSVADNINPMQLIPGVRDVLSIVQGYDVSRTDMSLVQDFWWAINDVRQKIEGTEKKTWASVITNLVQRMAAFTGLGFENLINDTISVINTVLDVPGIGDTAPAQFMEYQIASSQYDRGYKGNLNTFVGQALSAYAADNKELGDQIVKDLLNAGIEEDAIRSKLSNMLSDDERLETAAQLKIDGDAGYDSLVQEMEDDGYPRDLIENKIASKLDDLAPSYRDVIASLETILESGDFKSQNYETFNDQISSLVKAKQAKNGWTAKETRKNIRTQITKEFKPRYEAGNSEERQQILNLLSRVRVLGENIYEDEDITSWAD